MTWRAPTNDSTGFWDEYSRELPGLISVSLHISVGIHAKGELTHFCRFHPPECITVKVCTFTFRMKDSIVWLTYLGSARVCLAAVIGSTKHHWWNEKLLDAAEWPCHICVVLISILNQQCFPLDETLTYGVDIYMFITWVLWLNFH